MSSRQTRDTGKEKIHDFSRNEHQQKEWCKVCPHVLFKKTMLHRAVILNLSLKLSKLIKKLKCVKF